MFKNSSIHFIFILQKKLVNHFKSNFLKVICKSNVKSLSVSDCPSFLILMNQNIGDMIVCSPIIREIKLAFPNSELQVLINPVNEEMAEANPNIDKVQIYRNKWFNLLPVLAHLRKNKFDFAIELEAKVMTKVIIMLKIIKPRCILAVSKTEGRYGMAPDEVQPYDFYTNPELTHQRDTALDILRLLNIEPTDKYYDIYLKEIHRKKALTFLSSFDKSKFLIAFNLEGANIERRISKEDAAKIMDDLAKIHKNIIFILINKPGNSKISNEIIAETNNAIAYPCFLTGSVLDIAAIISNVDLIISPDTSIVHMACAFNKPLVAIYENNRSNYDKWSPISSLNHVIFSDESNNLKSINTNQVVNCADDLLSENLIR